ncbi:restriction endonuclease [Klenkia terrae]|uniref:restriction endonuclease n=1 Tax=Klenkia terrae TaxID=1052259 RepID=UPI0036244E05
MTGTIHTVLDRLRSEALDERDKGSKFERLIRAYLTSDPEWKSRFSDVWLWSDWPERAGRPDTGIDLVAANADDGGLTAIQCKFYAPGRTVAKADIDSFVSASASAQFTRRIVFDTAAGWSTNAEETLAGEWPSASTSATSPTPPSTGTSSPGRLRRSSSRRARRRCARTNKRRWTTSAPGSPSTTGASW